MSGETEPQGLKVPVGHICLTTHGAVTMETCDAWAKSQVTAERSGLGVRADSGCRRRRAAASACVAIPGADGTSAASAAVRNRNRMVGSVSRRTTPCRALPRR